MGLVSSNGVKPNRLTDSVARRVTKNKCSHDTNWSVGHDTATAVSVFGVNVELHQHKLTVCTFTCVMHSKWLLFSC